MEFYLINGGNKATPRIAKRAGWLYGSRDTDNVYGRLYAADYNFSEPDTSGRWARYVALIKEHQPNIAIVGDATEKRQVTHMIGRSFDFIDTHTSPVIVPKFVGPLSGCVPLYVAGRYGRNHKDVIIGISVPSEHAGFLPRREALVHNAGRRKLHLLGGHPDQWRWLIQYYSPVADVVSVDGNVFLRKARWGQYWSRYGRWVDLRGQGYDTNALAILSLKNAMRFVERGASAYTPTSKRLKSTQHFVLQPPLFY